MNQSRLPGSERRGEQLLWISAGLAILAILVAIVGTMQAALALIVAAWALNFLSRALDA